jgi:anti-sigma B factor antagonist/stage II sporulation protein AA (anti-sigma F factor antagonist)
MLVLEESQAVDDEFRVETFAAGDGALGLRVHGELDTATADQLVDAVESWPDRPTSCVVDLHNCEFLDSSGIRALLLCQRALDGGAGMLRLVGVRPHIDRVLRIAGVQTVLELGSVDGDS